MIEIGWFGPGERLVFEPYTREMFERTHRWMEEWKLFPEGKIGTTDYEVRSPFRDNPASLGKSCTNDVCFLGRSRS